MSDETPVIDLLMSFDLGESENEPGPEDEEPDRKWEEALQPASRETLIMMCVDLFRYIRHHRDD